MANAERAGSDLKVCEGGDLKVPEGGDLKVPEGGTSVETISDGLHLAIRYRPSAFAVGRLRKNERSALGPCQFELGSEAKIVTMLCDPAVVSSQVMDRPR